jgi:DNA-binding CsgD family transcriptional regulator
MEEGGSQGDKLAPGENLSGKVANQIKEEADPQRVSGRLPEVLADTGSLGGFAGQMLEALIARAGLSPRKLEVVNLYAQGLKPDEIAAVLGIARGTVYKLFEKARLKFSAG